MTYFVQALAYNGSSWVEGKERTFTTTGVTGPPYGVTVEPAENVTATGMTVVGNLTGLGTVASADVNVQYWVRGNKNATEEWVDVGRFDTPGTFRHRVTGLEPDTTYVVRTLAYSKALGWRISGTRITTGPAS